MSARTPQTRRPDPPAIAERLTTYVLNATLGAAIFGILLDLTIRDAFRPLAPFFYMFPPQLGVLLTGALTVAHLRRRRGRAALLTFLVMLVGATLVCGHSWRGDSGSAAESTAASLPRAAPLRVLTWNLFHGHLGVAGVAAAVHRLHPDIAALIECGEHEDQVEVWGKALPAYTVVPVANEVLLVTRGRVSDVRRRRLGPRSRLTTCRVRVAGLVGLVGIVDLVSQPFANRRRVFRRLHEEWSQLAADTPGMLLGDFNTPRRSRFFAPLRERLRNAFEVAGHGFGFTWPACFPLWDLDQIWVNDRWRVLSAESLWTARSDHCPLLITLEERAQN